MSLQLHNLTAGYARGTTLHQVTLQVSDRSVQAIVGHNGAGKTTLLHTIAGLNRTSHGIIRYNGQDISRWPAHHRARAGIALVPQGRRVFGSLTVAEHLAIAHRRHFHDGPEWTTRRVLDLLPQLAARLGFRGSQLSGGEQQMLAIARALLTKPRLLLMDEPTEGLAPQLALRIQQLIGELATTGLAILLASPHPALPVAVADHITVLTAGRITTQMVGADARADASHLHSALTPGAHASAPPGTSASSGRAAVWVDLPAAAATLDPLGETR